ncbi:MAG: tetratricopeptide repeat protein [Treponemataceae bacterium]
MTFSLIFFLLIISCKSTEPANITIDEKKGHILSLPQKEDDSFSAIQDKTILTDITIASPTSLRRAIGNLRQISNQSLKSKNILLYVATKIYTLAYPAEKKINDVRLPNVQSQYLDILEAVQQGVYQFNTSTDDFFELVLPSLVVFVDPDTNNYYEDAQNSLLKALKMEKDSVLANYLLAMIYKKQHKSNLAQSYFEKAFLLDSENYNIAILYADSILSSDPVQAYEIGQNFIKKNIYTQELFILCTEAAIRLKKWEEAEKYISYILQTESHNTKFLLLRIQVLLEKKDYLRAASLLDSFDSAGKLKVQSKDYLLLRSRLQFEWNKNNVLALETLEQALVLYPNDIDVLLAVANLSIQSNQSIKSFVPEDIAKSILEKNENNLSALLIFIESNKKKKNWKNVLHYANKYLQQTESTTVLLDKAWALYGLGQTREAIALLSKLDTDNPHNDVIQQALIKMQIFLGQKKTASNKIHELLPKALAPMKSTLYYYLSLLTQEEETKLTNLRLSLTANPRNIDSLFALYLLYFTKTDYRKAQYYLRQVVALDPFNQEYKRLEQQLKNKID